MSQPHIVVIGAGVGGLTAAAALTRAGLPVTVLEAHVYPGGCAGTFYHQGYRFDAGATLAGGFYPGGPMDRVARATGIDAWPGQPADPAMDVYLPDGSVITRYGSQARWVERRRAFGPASEAFWQWQERTADALWTLALRTPTWPPQTPGELVRLLGNGLGWLGQDFPTHLRSQLMADAVQPVARRLGNASPALRQFVDGQLLIAAQTTSHRANALYGAAALDLPRRGIMHMTGGMGTIAETLAAAVEENGGRVSYRQTVTQINMQAGRPRAVITKRGEEIRADLVIANLPPWNIAQLLGNEMPSRLARLPEMPRDGWGAFMVYAGVDTGVLPADAPLHYQIIVDTPLGEGNSVFLSFGPGWDTGRAPPGRRALTMSTHTELAPWWTLFEHDPAGYQARKAAYTERVYQAAARAVPGLRDATNLIKPGTPVTFRRFTRRGWGWVGGFPQTNLFRAWGPRIMPGLWMAGDSIFPGQSTAAVALGGLRVADGVLHEI